MDEQLYIRNQPEVSLRDLVLIAWRRKWVITTLMALGIGGAATLTRFTPERWRSSAQIIVIQRQATNVSAPADTVFTAPMVETPETQVAMLQSEGMAQRTAAWLRTEAADRGVPGEAADVDAGALRRAITVSSPKETNLLEVSVEARSAADARRLADAVSRAFVAWKTEIAQSSVRQIADNLEVRASRARAQMLAADQRETDFKRVHKLADPPAQMKAAMEQYLQRDAEAQTQRQELTAQEARLASLGVRLKDANQAIRSGTGVRDDSQVMALQTRLNELEMQKATAELKYTREYPGVLPDLDAQIADVKGRLAKAVQSTLDNTKPSLQSQGSLFEEYKQAQTTLLFARARLAAAVRLRDQLRGATTSLPQVNMEFARLQREAELAREQNRSLQAALNSARFDRDRAGPNVQIAQPAVLPDEPFSPNPTRDLLLGGLVGAFLSFVAALFLEQSDRRLRHVEDIRRVASGPIIGTLPSMSGRTVRRMLSGETPPEVVEAYTLARANLGLVVRSAAGGTAPAHQVILVTSALPGEGKSVTCVNMARAMAMTGKQVILVDADMRRSTVNRHFGTAEETGLADVLEGRKTADEALVATDLDALTVLHAGTPDRSPAELIAGQRMKDLLEALRGEADAVIVDAPACTAVADALLLAPLADTILFVVGAGQVDEELVRDATAALRAADPKSIVFFVNRVPKPAGYGRRGHYYYHYKSGNGNGHAPGRNGHGRSLTAAGAPKGDEDQKEEVP